MVQRMVCRGWEGVSNAVSGVYGVGGCVLCSAWCVEAGRVCLMLWVVCRGWEGVSYAARGV